MKFKFFLDCGFVGTEREELIDIPDEEFDGLSSDEIDRFVEEEYLSDWVHNYISYYAKRV